MHAPHTLPDWACLFHRRTHGATASTSGDASASAPDPISELSGGNMSFWRATITVQGSSVE